MSLPSLDQESNLPIPLSPGLAPCASTPKGVTDDVLVSANLPTTLNDLYELDVCEQSDIACELDISITPEVEPRDLDESQEVVSQELCDEVTELTILDFDDDILYAEYESFSYEIDVTEGLVVGSHVEYESFSFDSIIPDLLFKFDDNLLCAEYESFSYEFETHGSSDDGFCADYESFSFDPIQTDFLSEYYKSEFVKSEIIATKNFALDQTYTHIGLDRLVSTHSFA